MQNQNAKDAAPAGSRSFLDLLRSQGPATKVVAHRGDSFRAPENTLEAAELAFRTGAFAWELDVHLSADGVPVVIHDESLLRTTNVAEVFKGDPRAARRYPVSEFTLPELQRLNAGAWFLSETGGTRSSFGFRSTDRVSKQTRERCQTGQIQIPTLKEALQATKKWGWLVNVEIKSFPKRNDRLVGLTVAEIQSEGLIDKVLISGFDHLDLAEVRKLEPKIPTGLLVDQPLYKPGRYLEEIIGADCFHPSADVLGANSEKYLRNPSSKTLREDQIQPFVEKHHPILVYTVNQTRPDGLASHLAEAGISGVITDDPEGMIGLLKH